MGERTPDDARRCPFCRQPECDKHSLHQQLNRHAVTVPVSLTEGVGRIDGVVTDRGAERLDKRVRGKLTIRG